MYIGGIDAYNSTLKEISVLNAGWCGSHVVDWASGDPAYGPMSALSVVAPNLTLVSTSSNHGPGDVRRKLQTGQKGILILNGSAQTRASKVELR